ncbi:MAG: hypothetical protein KAI66_09275 [Lentisphaeria bacterium]|nr:hypothetical protein [Lentisphaeria bacterium]
MKIRGQRRKANCYTLIEVVAAGGLLMILSTTALSILHQTWLHSRDTMRNTQLCGESALLRKAWRSHVHACSSPVRFRDGELVAEGDWAAMMGDDKLLLHCGEDEKALRIPVGMDAALTVEDGGRRAVLTLGWRSGGPRRHYLRIVACPRVSARRDLP